VILEDSTDDTKIKSVLVKTKKNPVGFKCDTDDSENCEHVKYTMLSPDAVLSLIYVEKNDIESIGDS
jgi:hypothetical protein